MKIELDLQCKKSDATPIQNFLRESKYLILLSEEGYSKVVVLK